MKLFKKEVKDDLLEERSTEKKESILKNKKVLIGGGVVVLLILLLILKSILGSGKSGADYFDTVESIFSSELGYFKYTISIGTGEKGSLITAASTSTDTSVDDLSSLEGTTETVETTSKNEFQDWNKYADVKDGNWQYPNYKITIEGNTTSLEPLTTDFTVTLATANYNDVFTEVMCIDGNYYIDVESMYNWLKSSGDSYLVEVGSKLPNGSKWLVIPENEFKIASRYAEDGEEELSECTGLVTWYRRFLVALNSTKSSIQSSVGSAGQSTSNGVVSISLTGDNATTFASVFKNLAVRSGDFYESLVSTGYSSGLYDDTQYKQAIREKDNFIEAMYDLAVYMQVTDLSSLSTNVTGSARTYTNGYGNTQVEASMNISYSGDEDVVIKFTGIRSGDNNEIQLPSGSQTKSNDSIYRETLDLVFDYLNFTKIKTSVQLDINPDTISDEILERFIELVNSVGTSSYYVTKNNVYDFIETYSNLKVTNDTSANDATNVQLVQDLATSLNNIVGGIVVEKEVESELVVEQYPEVVFEQNGVVFTINYVLEDSNSKIMKLHVEVLNKSDSEYTFNATDFSLRSLLNSTYPANNETLLRNANNVFDMTQLVSEVTLASHEWFEFDMFFTPSDDDGHLDLYFGETNCGSVVEY